MTTIFDKTNNVNGVVFGDDIKLTAELNEFARNDDIGLHFFKALHVEQKRPQKRDTDEHIPAAVEYQEKFVERDDIIQPTMDRIACLDRDKVFREEVQYKIPCPAKQKQQMAESGLANPFQGKTAVIIHLPFHCSIPPAGCCYDTYA